MTIGCDLSTCATVTEFRLQDIVPDQANVGTWVGRVWVPEAIAENGLAGPRVVQARDGRIHDLSALFPTMSALINHADPVVAIREAADLPVLITIDELLANSLFTARASTLVEEQSVVLLAPNDLLATKACGVTFVKSLLERVVEEKAQGDATRAQEIRNIITDSLGFDLTRVKPGSPETEVLKKRLQEAGIWSQYLEVGIGKDAEVFTKHQPMASVSFGAQIGILPDSSWNNPEPEVVLAISRRGEIRGTTLGNDVNLRDYEGRSALLLGEAKDQNGSCSIGPFLRLFDESFSMETIKACEIELTITGADGFRDSGRNRMAEISRPPEELAAQVVSEHHQYPDGLVLFLGTMFAPTEDRGEAGLGFTHKIGDRVEIASPELGRLVNWVNHTHRIPRWEYGISELIEHLRQTAAI